ncbi:hypothetical protein BpHYR1_051539 [Brachionus plicatilis]|uniref:Uncharacterized protein n=1 Tax=Brachionus plicatilis TaxID=10195 RepID=A0A3M7SFU7_BRAPC|nr:hypothetical protein BpHYR1_051539 [Brachionus plicatilis]
MAIILQNLFDQINIRIIDGIELKRIAAQVKYLHVGCHFPKQPDHCIALITQIIVAQHKVID